MDLIYSTGPGATTQTLGKWLPFFRGKTVENTFELEFTLTHEVL